MGFSGKKKAQRLPRWIKGLTVGVVTGLTGAALGLSFLGLSFERNVGLPWLFGIRGALEPPPELVVVAIDARTGEHLGLPSLTREWPRSIHGKLVDALVERGASAIAFDVHFAKAKSDEDDLAFAESVKRADRVVLFEKLTGRRAPVSDQTGRHVGSVWVEELVPPIPALAESAKGLGPFPLPKVSATVYQSWIFKDSVGDAPTLPAVALQLSALEYLPEWLQLLEQAGATGLAELPAAAEALTGAESLRHLMRTFRGIFVNDPDLGKRVVDILNRQERTVFSERVNDLLKGLLYLYSGDSVRYLNFYGPPGTIRTIPYHAVIKGEDPNLTEEDLNFTNKIVFVGFSDLYDPGQPDRFYTVFTNDDGVDLSGVEIAATSLGNILSGSSLGVPDLWTTLFVLFGFGLVMGLVVYLFPALIGVPISIAMAACYAVAVQWVFNGQDIWLPMAIPLLVQYPMALFMGLLAQYLLERRRGQHITEAISYYLPENVARDLSVNALDPSDANKVTFSTCLATDMSGFSTIAEKLTPGELAEFLNDYFDALAEPLRAYHVDVTEFRADAIMCAWTGDPSDVDVRRQPILASLDALEAIARFKQRHKMLEGQLRIGLEVGTVYVGHAGGGGHFVYSIVGDPANTASRIEGLNKQIGTQILAAETVVDGIDDLLLRRVGSFQFVGKTEGLPIVEILSRFSIASSEQKRLCEQFSQALDLFQKGEWEKASERFEATQTEFPNDGPSGFYLALCRQYLDGAAAPEDPAVIKLTKK